MAAWLWLTPTLSFALLIGGLVAGVSAPHLRAAATARVGFRTTAERIHRTQ